MGSPAILFFLSAILPNLLLTISAQRNYRTHICLNTANYTTNSTYQQNLNTLLSSLLTNPIIPADGFHNSTAGENPDKVYALFLCRGDVSSDSCRRCVNESSLDVLQRCPNRKEALIWYEHCMLRYSNRSIFSKMEENPFETLPNRFNVSNPDQFNNITRGLMDRLVTRVSSGSGSGSVRAMFATGHEFFTIFQTIYGLVQCTPDISASDCGVCLRDAIRELPNCCNGKRGGRIFMPSCNLRYLTNPFYETEDDNTPDSSPPLASPPLLPPSSNRTIANREKGRISTRSIIIIVVCTVIIVILLSCLSIIWFLSLRRKLQGKARYLDEFRNLEYLQFDFGTIRDSTNNFSDANKLGEGGYGVVYKGKLWNGQDIAVKRLSGNSRQGDVEFKNEVNILAKLHHRNLVRLLGFCLKEEEKILVYEFVPNTSLDHFIFDPVKCAQLDWETRYKIIGGIARGLLYLHEDSQLRIVHRDLKASNVLLHNDMNAKISDFGMARLFLMDQSQDKTSHIIGTYAYMAPEYAMHGQYSVKSDVFSFGVLLLEIVSGKKNIKSESNEDLLSYAWRKWKEGTSIDTMDPTLRDIYSSSEVMRCVHIGLLCVQDNAADRPTMALVSLMLNCESFILPSPSQPAFFVDGKREIEPNMHESDQSRSESSAAQSVNGASITELYPR